MKINKQAPEKITYIGVVALMLFYFGYCRYNGQGLFYFMDSHPEKWSPQGASNGFHHK
jgi:hypothetical protein